MRFQFSFADLNVASASESGMRPLLRIGEFRKPREFLTAAFAYRLGEISVEIAEEREPLLCAPFLAHENHRRLREQQIDRRESAHDVGRRNHAETLASRAIADLIM